MKEALSKKTLGIALDIGTTEIKGSLLDIAFKKELARANVPNEQAAFGQDVITRLYFATKREGLKELNKKLISAINRLIEELAEEASVDLGNIKKIIAVGNSAMYHLALMIRTDTLAKAPFLPAEKKVQERNANKMGINVASDTTFKFLPNISGFVGSDILASILVTGMHRNKKYSLIMDMGTNGEIALGSQKKIYVTSCASGPAFEGRHIRCGMPARDGAIIAVRATKRNLFITTLGSLSPRGISGSGIIDIVSILLDKKIIDRKGRMMDTEFIIYRGRGKKIYLTQEDVRQTQLAKAAFASGIEILRRKADIELANLNRFYITGAFGEGINKRNAKNIGLLPKDVSLDKIEFLKDSALSGTEEVLLAPSREREINNILAKCKHIELHKDKEFKEVFASSMHF